jgi:hypothetical protein
MKLKVTPHDFDPVSASAVPLYRRYCSIVYILISKSLHNNQFKSDFRQTGRVSYDSAEYFMVHFLAVNIYPETREVFSVNGKELFPFEVL